MDDKERVKVTVTYVPDEYVTGMFKLANFVTGKFKLTSAISRSEPDKDVFTALHHSQRKAVRVSWVQRVFGWFGRSKHHAD